MGCLLRILTSHAALRPIAETLLEAFAASVFETDPPHLHAERLLELKYFVVSSDVEYDKQHEGNDNLKYSI